MTMPKEFQIYCINYTMQINSATSHTVFSSLAQDTFLVQHGDRE